MYLLKSRKVERARFIRPKLMPSRFSLSGDKDLEEMMRVSAELDAKNYAGGWCQLMNWKNCVNYPAAAKNTYTSIADITHASEVNSPCIPSTTLVVGSMLHIVTFGTAGSAAGTATTTIGHYLNGAASGVQMSISASQTPATSTVNNFRLESWSVVNAEGGSGTILTNGILIGLGATPATNVLVPTTQPTAAAISTIVNNGITTAASWNTSASGNTYTVNGHLVFLYN